MREKRSLERKKTYVFFGVYNRQNATFVGRLVNINTSGIMIIGKTENKINECYELKMDLPQEINGKSQLVFDAQIKWCERSKKTKLFSTGFEFTKIEPEYLQLIDELVDNTVFNDPAAALPISVNFESAK
jgi:hypothetical protein